LLRRIKTRLALDEFRWGANVLTLFEVTRTCRERRAYIDPKLLTRSGHQAPLFVATHFTNDLLYFV